MKFTQLRLTLTVLLLGLCVPAFASPAPLFQDEGESQGSGGDEDSDVDEDELDDEQGSALVIVGGDIYTGTGAFLRGATLLAREGKIKRIGYDIDVPEDAEVVNAEGMRVYPGLVVTSSSGLLGGSGDLEDSIDPFNQNMILGLAAGITTTGAGSGAAKLKRYEIEGAVLDGAASFATLAWSNSNPSGKRNTRLKMKKAAKYLRAYRQWEEDKKDDKDLKEPSRSGVDTTSLAILRGEKTAKFNASDRSDLLGIARFCQEFDIQPVIEGAGEGWTVADELGRAGARIIINPRYRRWKDENLVRDGGSSIENAAKLHAAGCQIAILPGSRGISLGGIVGRDIMHLTIEAGFAVRGGLSETAAIEAITIVPARMMGVGHRVGSLEVGKDADIIVTDGDLLHYQTFVQWAFVDGKLVYDKEEELYFAHIRPRPETELAPVEKVDAGEDPVEDEEGDEEEEDAEGEDEEEGDDDSDG